MPDIAEGKKAPDFSLPNGSGGRVSLSQFRGKKNVVLYFYPKDNTPGCTREACDFRDSASRFAAADTEILGVSADSCESHARFSGKFSLPFGLLSDAAKDVLKKFGVWKKKSLYGRSFMGIERTTVLIDKEGRVRRIFPKVKVEGHVREVLEAAEGLEKD